ncbi:MAG TPA: asparagine synthase-related protein [Pyrinomonadaceae bacterium]|nr:asparagine synthase-related protein [Pyrinomonadaceae bacterium]
MKICANALIDAQSILNAYEKWGDDCVKHLLGDFAFAIWDDRRKRLFCARDHFGVKPFFYTHTGNSFNFSSSLTVLKVSTELNEIAIGDYLLFGVNQDQSTTIFKEIQRLPPGHTLTVENNQFKIQRYWTPSLPPEVRFRDPETYVERFSELLDNAVADRLGTGRVAISMSGGLDSTSLAAIASKHAEVAGFTVVYDSLIPDEERRYSSLAAKHLGIPITHLNADAYSLFDGEMDQAEPFLISPLTGQFNDLLRLCAGFAPVALTGYDGDSLMNEPRIQIRTRIRRMLRKNDYHGFFPEWIDESFAMRTNLRERLRDFWVKREDGKRPAAMRALKSNIWTALFEGYDPVATRLNLEVRHPFIDLRLVEYLLAIPAVPWCVDKHILRCAMKNKLPEAVLNRHKTGLAGDPALQLVRRASVRWLDSFEVSPQLRAFVNLDRRRSVVEEETADGRWASLRVFALNYWLTHSRPSVRRTSETPSQQKPDLNRLNCLNMETMHGT